MRRTVYLLLFVVVLFSFTNRITDRILGAKDEQIRSASSSPFLIFGMCGRSVEAQGGSNMYIFDPWLTESEAYYTI